MYVPPIVCHRAFDLGLEQLSGVDEDRAQETGCKGQLITLSGQRQSSDPSQRKQTAQVVLAVQCADMLDQSPVRRIPVDGAGMVDILVEQIMSTVPGFFDGRYDFVEAEEFRDTGPHWTTFFVLWIQQFISTRLAGQRRTVGIVLEDRIGVGIFCVRSQRFLLFLLVGRTQRRVFKAAPVADRGRAKHIARMIDRERQGMSDPRVGAQLPAVIVQFALIMKIHSLAGVCKEHAVSVVSLRLEQLDGVVALRNAVGPVGLLSWGSVQILVEGIDLLSQDRTLEGTVRLA